MELTVNYYYDSVLPDGTKITGMVGECSAPAFVYVIPNTPTIISIDSGNYQYDHISYTPVKYAEMYDLYRLREGIDSEYQLVASFRDDGTNSYMIAHPADGNVYYYKMVAKASSVRDPITRTYYYPASKFSNILSSTIEAFVPTNVKAVSERDSEIQIFWDQVDEAYGYKIYRYSEESQRELIAVISDTETDYLDTDIEGGITYSYDIYAVDITGDQGTAANISCTAKGMKNDKTIYTVEFDTDRSTIELPSEKVVCGECSQQISIENSLMVQDGYEFVGWYSKPDGKGKMYTAQTPITADVTLYACWKEKATESHGGFYVAPLGDQEYTGKAIKPEVRVYDGNTILQEGTDYTVTYKNNTKVCDAESVTVSKAPTVIVKGKKNYTDKVSVPFSIIPIDINDQSITTEDVFVAYTGKNLMPVPQLWYNGKKLKNKTDYTVAYSAPIKDVGCYSISVIGKGGYTGKREILVTVTNEKLLSQVKIGKIPTQEYDGTYKKPQITAKYKNITLVEDTDQKGTGDYTVKYINNRNTGTATAVLNAVEGSGYVGSKTVTFNIQGISIKKAKVILSGNQTYSGGEIKPHLTVSMNEKNSHGIVETRLLNQGVDYTVSYHNNINVGTASIEICGKGKYYGNRTVKFKITPYDLSKLTEKSNLDSEEIGFFISVNDGEPVEYQKGSVKPPVIVGYSDYVLDDEDSIIRTRILQDSDFKITYSNFPHHLV